MKFGITPTPAKSLRACTCNSCWSWERFCWRSSEAARAQSWAACSGCPCLTCRVPFPPYPFPDSLSEWKCWHVRAVSPVQVAGLLLWLSFHVAQVHGQVHNVSRAVCRAGFLYSAAAFPNVLCWICCAELTNAYVPLLLGRRTKCNLFMTFSYAIPAAAFCHCAITGVVVQSPVCRSISSLPRIPHWGESQNWLEDAAAVGAI